MADLHGLEGDDKVSDPATKEDLERVRIELVTRINSMGRSLEGMRSQNSAEHGSLFSKLLNITEVLHWVRARWERFTRVPDGPPENRK